MSIYSARSLAAELQTLADRIREDGHAAVEKGSPEYVAIANGASALRVADFQVGALRDTLAVYADPAFYDEALPQNTMASKDRGQKAANVLRLTDPDPV